MLLPVTFPAIYTVSVTFEKVLLFLQNELMWIQDNLLYWSICPQIQQNKIYNISNNLKFPNGT